jgi:hypothetical protein
MPNLFLPKAQGNRQLFSRDFCYLLRGQRESVITPHAVAVRCSGGWPKQRLFFAEVIPLLKADINEAWSTSALQKAGTRELIREFPPGRSK